MQRARLKKYAGWYIFILIPLIGTLVFNFFPLFQTAVGSLSNSRGQFIGTTNYEIMFSSGEFRQTLVNTLYMAILGVTLNVPLAFIIASLLNNIGKGKGIFRVIFLLPMVMSMVTVVTLFKYLMMPGEDGAFNYLLNIFGMAPRLWLSDPQMAREMTVFIAVWKGIGYNIILFFAGLQGVPADMYEAAEIDGANGFKKWLYITIPSCKNTFTFVIITSTIAALKRFTEVYAISGESGNPAGVLKTILLYIYRNSFSTVNYKDEGLASAASVVLFVIILLATIINTFLGRDRDNKVRKKRRVA